MQWNKFRLSFNIYEDKNLLSPKHPLAWHIIIGSTPALPFYFIPVEQKTSPALVDQPVGHCQTEWTMNYFCLFFSSLEASVLVSSTYWFSWVPWNLRIFVILHVIVTGQWLFSGKKLFKGGDSQPACTHNHISLLSSGKQRKDVTVASLITQVMSGMRSINNFCDSGKDSERYLARSFSCNFWCQVLSVKCTNIHYMAFEKTQML